MPRYLIILPHENNQKSCDQAVNILKLTGSHFLTHADLGCHDDVHMAWLNIEVDSRDEAMQVVPPFYRNRAQVIELERLSLESIDGTLKPKHS